MRLSWRSRCGAPHSSMGSCRRLPQFRLGRTELPGMVDTVAVWSNRVLVRLAGTEAPPGRWGLPVQRRQPILRRAHLPEGSTPFEWSIRQRGFSVVLRRRHWRTPHDALPTANKAVDDDKVESRPFRTSCPLCRRLWNGTDEVSAGCGFDPHGHTTPFVAERRG